VPLHRRRARTPAKLWWRSILGSTMDQSAARSTGCGPGPPAFLVEKQFYFLYILRILYRGPRVLFKLQTSPRFQIQFNI
jgi:hypothetical protein